MTNKHVRERLNQELANVTVSEQLEQKILTLQQPMPRAHRRSLVALVACALLLIALPVLAATHSGFQALLSQVGNQIAELLQPIELVSESNGIRLEVVAAMNDDHKAVAYVTLQDITGNRLSSMIDFFDFHLSNSNRFYVNRAQYDENTNTATLQIPAFGEAKMNGKKVIFALRSFLSGYQEWLDVDIGIPLDTIPVVEESVWLNRENWQGASGGNFDEIDANGGLAILPLDKLHIPIPGIDFAYISNMGLIDGRLHVQTRWSQKGMISANFDDHGEFWLVDANGERLPNGPNDISVSYWADAHGDIRSMAFTDQGLLQESGGSVYQEEVFSATDIPYPVSLQGNFFTNTEFITGDWNVAFRLQAVKAFKQAECDIDMGTSRVRSITLSPIGWTILGEKQTGTEVQTNALMRVLGKIQTPYEVIYFIDNDTTFEFHALAKEPLDISGIDEAVINGESVPLS